MKARKIGYWVATALLAVAFLAGGVFDLGQSPAVGETLAHLGYPAYLALLLGAWKVLGALAVFAPGLPRLKEWAYAGMMFDLTGALVSHAAVSDGADKLMPPIVLLIVLGASWALRPERRKLGAVRGEAPLAASPREPKWLGARAA
jgi:uncharacterized membrane protein YphA (DoxX/SURF4 family)